MVKSLLSKGADPNVPNELGNTPLYTIIGYKEVRIEIGKLSLEKGADKTIKNKQGRTSLERASIWM